MNRFVEKVSQFLDYGARIAVAAIMFVTTINVVMRLFGSALRGAVEIVQYLTALGVGMGLALCAFHGGHVAVTFFTDMLPKKVQLVILFLVDCLVLGFLGVTTWQLVLYGQAMQQSGEIALTTGMPIYPVVYLVVAGFVAYLVVVIHGLGKTLAELFAGTPAVAIKPEDNISVEDLISQ